MPLILEVLHPEFGWRIVGRLEPGDPPGSMSNNTENGTREIYMFACAGDFSWVERSNFGIDVEITRQIRGVSPDLEKLETIAELRAGEMHEMQVKTDSNPEVRTIRFRHE